MATPRRSAPDSWPALDPAAWAVDFGDWATVDFGDWAANVPDWPTPWDVSANMPSRTQGNTTKHPKKGTR